MKFLRTSQEPAENKEANSVCFLINDNWDDFGFKTSFIAVLFDAEGLRHNLGGVRILRRGQKEGRVPLPNDFDELETDWCSLGYSREYYVNLSRVSEPTLSSYLKAIRDCVSKRTIFDAFESEDGMQSSLLRTVSRRDVVESFPRILSGDAELSPYEFSFHFETGSSPTAERCEFAVQPNSKPPTNVHVLIGRNGVGKTRLLAGMADALTENKAGPMGLAGEFVFTDAGNEFLNVIVVSYSAFDRFDPIFGSKRSKGSIPYYYIGIKKQRAAQASDPGDSIALKNPEDFNREFSLALKVLANRDSPRFNPQKFRRWLKALDTLRSDPGLANFIADFITGETNSPIDEATKHFASLSSGHKIVLLTIAGLVENVSDRSLVILDEPETHLHPPLLGSFIRAISELLISQNGVAIVATHSPVVLQEVPARCVSMISRSGERMRILRPKTETFAENVGLLTRRVFGLEVTQSGFYRMLQDAARDRDFSEVIEEFGGEVGGEGRALTRVFTSEAGEE